MAMVDKLNEDEVTNQNENEGDSHVSEDTSSRSSSRNSNNSKRSSPGVMPQYQYSRAELMELSKVSWSQKRPKCLDPVHNNSTGKWDPEKWFVNKRGDKLPPVEEPRAKRERQDIDITLSHKRRTSDPRERIKEEKDEIILSPQRRSFGTGCHVIQHSLAKRPGSPVDIRDGESFRERRIGSGRIMNRDRERDWELEHRDYGRGVGSGNNRNDRRDRFDQDEGDKDGRHYSSRYNRDRNDRRSRGQDRIEEEPEWFSGGPVSQSETIELVGFDDVSNENEVKRSNRKSSKRNKDGSRRQSVKSEEEKSEPVHASEEKSEKGDQTKSDVDVSDHQPIKKSSSPDLAVPNGPEETKSNNVNFDLDDLFRMDWIPGLLQSETPPENAGTDIGCSRFSQWFRRDSPVLANQGSGSNSRRSSLHEELVAHVLSGIGDPQLMIPSPTPNDSCFAPISPAHRYSPLACPILPPHPVNDHSRNILEMLQSNSDKNAMMNGEKSGISDAPRGSANIKELEADLKRMLLGSNAVQTDDDTSAFNKLLQHMSETTPTSMSIGPMDKSKALQEEDLLQNILGQQPSSPSQMQQHNDQNFLPNASGEFRRSNNIQSCAQVAHDMFGKQLQEPQHLHQAKPQPQFAEQLSQVLMLQQHEKPIMHPRFAVDGMPRILDPPPHLSPGPLSPGIHPPTSVPFNRNDTQSLNAMLQQQRHRELVSSMVKQRQIAAQMQQGPTMMHPIKGPSTKDFAGAAAQTLGLPTLAAGPSPRQSPLPPDSHGPVHPQGRIPSPLVFGQQPPALSHAPAPIHPNHLVQAMAPNAANSNTLQVQNPMMMQRVPSPQELAVHTQTILQNALIKRKLEEQKENYRKRQEAQRTNSPVMTKHGNGSPLKGLSPIAFTPTSVMRKMHSEKNETPQQKNDIFQNGFLENRLADQMQNVPRDNTVPLNMSTIESVFNPSSSLPSQTKSSGPSMPRPVYGQSMMNPIRSQQQQVSVPSSTMNMNPAYSVANMNPPHNMMNLNPPQGQGRPIVKGGNGHITMNQASGSAARVTPNMSKHIIPNKHFPTANNQFPDRSANVVAVNKILEQQQRLLQQQKTMLEQRRQAASPMPPIHTAAAAATFAFGPRGHNINTPVVRPLNLTPAAAATVAAPNINIPLLRTMMQANPAIRAAQTCPLSPSQLRTLGQWAAIQQMQQQQQRGIADNNQMSAPVRNYHPLAFQQLLLNSQSQVAVQAQTAGSMAGAHGDGKHTHLMPGQSAANRQSPVNLTKWFGNDVLKQKMPELPADSHQKALRLEDLERQQQHSTVVHN